MATATANKVTIQITAAMRLGALMRSMSVETYLAQLCDADVAGVRAVKIVPAPEPLFKELPDSDWRSMERNRMSASQKEKALSMLAEGISPSAVATRLGVSAPTIYRIRNEYRKGRAS
jgi:hypothetical protein